MKNSVNLEKLKKDANVIALCAEMIVWGVENSVDSLSWVNELNRRVKEVNKVYNKALAIKGKEGYDSEALQPL